MAAFVKAELSDYWQAYALWVAEQRMEAGLSKAPRGTAPNQRVDDIGALAEVAVCLHYGEDPHRWVRCLPGRPACAPDFEHDGYTVGVKGTGIWNDPLLTVASHDENAIHVLCSVHPDSGKCGLWGWITRQELKQYPIEARRDDLRHPARQVAGKGWIYVPVGALHPCQHGG